MRDIYETAKSLLGYHLTMNEAIPREYGCAQAVSKVLSRCGYAIPRKGISSTIDLNEWLKAHAYRIEKPEQGCIIISPTEGGNIGHVGVIGRFGLVYPGDFGIMSNTSGNGLWQMNYSLADWKEYFCDKKGLPIIYYVL